MQTLLALLVGIYMAAAVYLMLSKQVLKLIFGVALLSNGINLLIFTAGRLTSIAPAFVPIGSNVPENAIANPLPQALILTAIVIGLSFFVFLLVLVVRVVEELGTGNSDQLTVAEPKAAIPPMGY